MFFSTIVYLCSRKLLQTMKKKMNLMKRLTIVCLGMTLVLSTARAQLSANVDKFLGNITTSGQVDYGSEAFHTLWNQLTAENESKWQSVEGTRGVYNWAGSDRAYNYAKQYGFPFKFHTLVWGSQYPTWMNNLSTAAQYEAIEKWMDAIKARYPDLPMIDVVNEAIAGHAPAPFKAALGGDGATGYDWIIKAFEMAHERWPEAILIYNDYNTFQWQKKEFIDLVKILRDAGAPIDAYGCQSHDLTDMNLSQFKSAMAEIQNALKMPMYSTEYDIGTTDDNLQLQRYKEQIPLMWEADYCAGITLWGYIYGHTWTPDGNSGIIRYGQDRPAMTWLREYMQTDAAKKAKSPFPGMKKEASVYVKPSALAVSSGDEVPITIRASLRTKSIDHVELYVNNVLTASIAQAPYVTSYTPATTGHYDLKAVVFATDGSQYERWSGFTAYEPRTPYQGGTQWPGTLQFENFDGGVEGMTYHDSDLKDEGGTNYRNDQGGVDIVTGNGNYAIGYTATGEWLEYTVDVTEAGQYAYEAYVASGTTGSGFHIDLVTADGFTRLCNVSVPQTASSDWNVYKTVKGSFLVPLEKGRHIVRMTIDNPYCNLDKLVVTCTSPSGIHTVTASEHAAPVYTLDGRRVNPQQAAKGLYIYKGKKYIKK